MRQLLVAVFLLLINASVFGQVNNPEFTSVAKKFEKGNFESALESAESLIDNDKHRKKPEPYLWASMCFYEVYKSDDAKLKARFKSALRNALKHAGKAISKDKNGNLIENNAEYFETMKKEGIAFALEYESEENYRKASYTYKQLLKIAPDDPYIRFAKGVTDIKLSAVYEAEKAIGASFPILEESYRNLDYQPDPISSPLLKDAVLFYIDDLIQNTYVDSARKVILSARIFFPLDEDIKKRLESLR